MKPKHLAPMALVMMTGHALRNWFRWLVLVLIVATTRNWWNRWVVLTILGLLGYELIRAGLHYWRFTYLLAPTGITVTSGIFQRKMRHIPYSRVQTLQRQQWFFLRPFQLESLTIETAGQETDKGEASLLAVPLSVGDQIEQLRQPEAGELPAASATDEHSGPASTTAQSQADADYQIDSHDLNLYALSSFGVMPIILGVLYLAEKIPDNVQHEAMAYLAHLAVLVVLSLVAFGIGISLLLSYLGIISRYYQFELTRHGQTLTTKRGYFKRITTSVKSAHVQAIRIKQTVLRQWLHLATVQALVASNAAEQEDDADLVLLPVLPEADALKVMKPFVAWLPNSVPALDPVPAANRWLYIRNGILLYLLVDAVLLVAAWQFAPQYLKAVSLVAAILPVVGFFQGRYASRAAGLLILSPQLVVLQTGRLFARQRFFVPRPAIQSVTLSQSIWMRPQHRMHLAVNVRQGDGNEEIEVRYLQEATAVALRQWYLRET